MSTQPKRFASKSVPTLDIPKYPNVIYDEPDSLEEDVDLSSTIPSTPTSPSPSPIPFFRSYPPSPTIPLKFNPQSRNTCPTTPFSKSSDCLYTHARVSSGSSSANIANNSRTLSFTSCSTSLRSQSILGSFSSSISTSAPSVLPPYAPSPFSQPLDARAVLALDGGGVRGIFAPMLLATLQDEMPPNVDVRDIIDLVGGTSTGGVASLLYSRIGMSAQECIQVYSELPKQLFRHSSLGFLSWLFTSTRHSTANQRKIYKRCILKTLGDASAPLHCELDARRHRCPVFVVSVNTDDVSRPVLFRSYHQLSPTSPPTSTSTTRPRINSLQSIPESTPHNLGDPTERISILKAAMATSAAPAYFRASKHNGKTYIDGGLGFNNPSHLSLKELTGLYGPNAYAHTFISIGTGHRTRNPFKPSRVSLLGIKGMLLAFANICTDSEAVHEYMEDRFAQTGAYFRFNPPGLGDVELDSWTSMDRVIKICEDYLQLPETKTKIKSLACRLMELKEGRELATHLSNL